MQKNTKMPKDLEYSETHYQRIFESSPDGILIVDAASQTITDANPFITNLTEYFQAELLGSKLDKIILFNDKDENLRVLRELYKNKFIRLENIPLRTKTGELLHVEFTANLYQNNEHRLIQCNIRNVVDKKAVSSNSSNTEQELNLLARIAGKAARLGGWTISLPERKLTWSDENCIIHELPPGYQPTLEEGIGYFPEEYREEVAKYVDICATKGIPYDFELPKYTAKGNLIWVRSIGEAVRDADGKIIGLQGAFQDITARKKVEDEKEKLIKELQDVLTEVKTLQQFLPICSYCKKVRDDQNYWSQIESYISKHTDTKFSHGICPDCYEDNLAPQIEQLRRKNLADSESLN